VAAALDGFCANLGETTAPQAVVGLRSEAQPGGRPELGAEHAEDELRLRADVRDRLSPRFAVTTGVALELRRVWVGGRSQEGALAVREQRAGRLLGVQVFEAAFAERGAELGMCGASDPEWMPRAEDVVVKPR